MKPLAQSSSSVRGMTTAGSVNSVVNSVNVDAVSVVNGGGHGCGVERVRNVDERVGNCKW